jgi:hypothetical protein
MALAFAAERSVPRTSRYPAKTPATRGLMKYTMLMGTGLAVGAWMIAALATVHSMASIQPSDFSYQLRASLDLKPLAAPVSSDRVIRVAKFSRISSGATPKAARLEDAHFAHLTATRAAADNVKDSLSVALAAAEEAKKFASLAEKRPHGEVVKTALASALENTVLIAPPTETAWDASPAGNADGGEVEVADLQSPAELAVARAIGPDEDDSLPMAGPLPVGRPPANALALAMAKPAERAVVKPGRTGAPQEAEEEEQEAPQALAFARPENPMKSIAPAVPWPDRGGSKIAVYDITNGVVHMPNGEKLEAHSGIGEMRDNPKFTHVKMRGPTPPGTYKLSMREQLFHGVAAIRLTPTDGVAPLGRTGLLAHSYLLRTRGDSHGCVAFADYNRFLKAFQRGEITHMIIVDRHNGSIPATAMRKINPRGAPPSTGGGADGEARRTLVDYLKNDG